MSQNTSHAVMAQRAEPHDSLDDFPTPPWATRALCESAGIGGKELSVWEPACNRGYMARPLGEYFGRVLASDIMDYGWAGQQRCEDFLFPRGEPAERIDWIITNPPFRLAEQFCERAAGLAQVGSAVIVRTAFLEGAGRYRNLFRPRPPESIWQFVERVPMVKGRYDPDASTATSYCWLVWRRSATGVAPVFHWIPPCRALLERKADAIQ